MAIDLNKKLSEIPLAEIVDDYYEWIKRQYKATEDIEEHFGGPLDWNRVDFSIEGYIKYVLRSGGKEQ